MKEVFMVSLLFVFLSSARTQTQFWTQTNGPYGGTVYGLARDSVGRLYACTPTSGVFRSTDAGASWQRASEGLLSQFTYDLAVTPAGTLLATSSSWGVFRSTDFGHTWVNAGLIGTRASSIAAHFNGRVFVATIDSGLFRSTDDGLSWQQILPPVGFRYYVGVGITPLGSVLTSSNRDGVVRSTDGGDTWHDTNLDTLAATYCAFGNYKLYAGAFGDVYRSSDDGLTWARCWLNRTDPIALTVDHSGIIIAGLRYNGIVRSTNDGQTWTQTTITNRSVYALITTTENETYAATENGGVFVTSDGGATWSSRNEGLSCTGVSSVASGKSGELYAATYTNGVFRSTNNGLTWLQTSLSNDDFYCVAVDTDGHAFAGGFNYFYRSTDHGSSWIASPVYYYAVSCAVSPQNIVFSDVAIAGLRRSTDHGVSWQDVGMEGYEIVGYAFDSSGVFFTGGFANMPGTRTNNPPTLFRSTDQGLTWSPLGSEISVTSLVCNQIGDVFAGDYFGRVHVSTDSGNNWDMLSLQAYYPVWSIVANQRNHLFAGTDGNGVYRSLDGGETWTPATTGLTNMSIRSLVIDEDGYLFAGTNGSGVFRSSEPTTTSVDQELAEAPRSFLLFQNYPSPFNPSTTIRYGLPHASFVTLTIYNTLGQQVARLVNEQQQAGYHETVFRGDRLASGVYFYRLQAGDFVASKKLLLLK